MTDRDQDPPPERNSKSRRDVDSTPPRRSPQTGPVQYRGADLEPERGPGLGCFRFQLLILAIFVVLAPLSVSWGWPSAVSAGLLFVVILLLLVTGQTIIFLLRLVAADRRGRRRPLASERRTVGELEEEGAPESSAAEREPSDATRAGPEGGQPPAADDASGPGGPVRQ